MFFLENVFFLGLGDGENCSQKIFEKFEVFRGGGGVLLSIFINNICMFAPKH